MMPPNSEASVCMQLATLVNKNVTEEDLKKGMEEMTAPPKSD
jgi:hypothetical protein